MENFIDIPDNPDLPLEEEQELNSGKDLKLNDKQEQFCHEYMKDFNGGVAAMRAGYKPFGASHTAYRLLRTLAIKKRLRQLKQEQREQTHISFGFVVEKLIRIAEDALEGDPVLVYDQSERTWKDTGRRKPDRPTALKAIALLGKHIGMFDKEYAQTIEKNEGDTQEEQEKQCQLADSYIESFLNLDRCKEENEYLKEKIAEAGIEIEPFQPKPKISEYGNVLPPYVYKGPMRALNPSEYDDQPHYEYKHIMPHKNHPEHEIVTPEQMAEAIRKKADQDILGQPPESRPIPPKSDSYRTQ